jgi:hypothetical protein
LECTLVELFHWPLNQIDETDIETLIPFVLRYPIWKSKRGEQGNERKVYADQMEL